MEEVGDLLEFIDAPEASQYFQSAVSGQHPSSGYRQVMRARISDVIEGAPNLRPRETPAARDT